MVKVRTVSLPRNIAFVGVLVVGLLLSSASAMAAAPKQPSEPFFPRSGNRGYDVKHYDVSLGYQPRSGQLTARDVIEARATSGLRKFSLDLDGLKVTSVSVDGEAAEYSRGRGKVKIVPATPIAKGEAFKVELRYQGQPRKVTDPDGSTEGWYRTPDGAVGVGEPVPGTLGFFDPASLGVVELAGVTKLGEGLEVFGLPAADGALALGLSVELGPEQDRDVGDP